ncbi:hypothetical protein O181_112490 [Austropuccinia psidii MF-1]|uniref:Uncharacterized protein n=1 Tax=Austropuccinia psidii MF-1 TaxID=1389203 RepID=A0A9Q3K0K8_9BASI|nr:hypothetical protein [Austropuccinia psidii MF-1]
MEAQSNAARYKSVLKKVRPVNEAMPQDLIPPLERPESSRDPYETPLKPNPPLFIETLKVKEERISMINFRPVTTTKNDPPPLVLRQFQPGTNWPHHIFMANFTPSGALWHFGHILPSLASLANSQIPNPQASIFVLGPLAIIIGFGTPLFIRGSWPFWAI